MNYLTNVLIIFLSNILLLNIKPFSELLIKEKINFKKDNIKIMIANVVFFIYAFLLFYFTSNNTYIVVILLATKILALKSTFLIAVLSVSFFAITGNLITALSPILFYSLNNFYCFSFMKKINNKLIREIIVNLLLSVGLMSYHIEIFNNSLLPIGSLYDFFVELIVLIGTIIIYKIIKKEKQRKKELKEEHSQIKHQNKSFSSFKKSNQKILANFNLEETYNQLIQIGISNMGADRGGLLKLKKNNLVLIDGINIKEVNIKNRKGYIGDYFARGRKVEIKSENEIEKLRNNGARVSNLFNNNFQSIIISNLNISKEEQLLLFFIKEENNNFKEKDKIFIEELSNYAPLMIKKARILEERNKTLEELNFTLEKLDKNNKNLSNLNKASSLLNSTLKLEETTNLATEVVVDTFSCEESSLFLLEEKTGDLELKKCNSFNQEDNQLLVSSLYDIAKRTLKKKEISTKKISIDGMKAIISIPLIIQDKVIGIIQAIQNDMFDNIDKEFINTFSNQLGVAIQNSKMYNKMRNTAIRDGLTGLYNHSYFQEQLNKEINRFKREGQPLGLLILDIDDFKAFNDNYGHQAGDEVLRALAKTLVKSSREYDTVARYGGEEFVIILPNTSSNELVNIGKRYNEVIREMVVSYEDLKLKVTASIGVSSYNEDLCQKELIELADEGLYQAKEKGKDTTCFKRN